MAGFTLLELLIVIGIVTVVVAISLPVLGQVQRSSSKAKCSSNLRQLHSALAAYTGDHNGVLPQAADASSLTWDQALLDGKYIGDAKAFACPLDTLPRSAVFQSLPKRSYSVSSWVFPCTNAALLASSSQPSGRVDGRLILCSRPLTQIVLLFDRPTNAMVVGKTGSVMNANPAAYPLPAGPNPNMFHVNGANWLFADGHVEYLDFTQLAPNDLSQSQNLFAQRYFQTSQTSQAN